MATNDITKEDVLDSIDDFWPCLVKLISQCSKINEDSDLPKAFPVVSKHLSLVFDVFESIKTNLSSVGEEDLEHQVYSDIKKVAFEYYIQVGYLKTLIGQVVQGGDVAIKMHRYRSAVQDGQGQKVETVMLSLLNGAIRVAQQPLVSSEKIKALEKALEEVQSLPSSVESGATGATSVINYGSGNQLYYSGTGNQNQCSGGIQFTGNTQNATYNLSEDK